MTVLYKIKHFFGKGFFADLKEGWKNTPDLASKGRFPVISHDDDDDNSNPLGIPDYDDIHNVAHEFWHPNHSQYH